MEDFLVIRYVKLGPLDGEETRTGPQDELLSRYARPTLGVLENWK